MSHHPIPEQGSRAQIIHHIVHRQRDVAETEQGGAIDVSNEQRSVVQQQQEMATLTGRVVDIACLRRYPSDQYASRAQRHPTACALMGHCLESESAAVDDDDRVHLLDAEATPMVERELRRADESAGVRITVERAAKGDDVVTRRVELCISPAWQSTT